MIFTKQALITTYAGDMKMGFDSFYLNPYRDSGQSYQWGNSYPNSISNNSYNWKSIDPLTVFHDIKYGVDLQNISCAKFLTTYPTETAFLRLYNPLNSQMSQRDLLGYNQSFTIQMTCTYENFASNYRGILGMGRAISGGTGLLLGQYQNGNVVWGIFPYTTSSNSVVVPVTPANIPSGKFNWTFVYDNSTNGTGGSITLYFNGISKGTTNLTLGIPPFSTTADSIQGVSLGYAYNDTNRFMNGQIYSLLIYNRVLTLEEIKHNYLHDQIKYHF